MEILPHLVQPDVRRRLERLDLPFDPHGYDPFGVQRDWLGFFFSALRPFYKSYFRVRVHGLEHVPARGRAMIVGNHSGGIPVDGLTILCSLFFEMEPPRLAHGMVEKFMAAVPFFGDIAREVGQVTGLPEHAVRMLEDGRLLMVFPEGARGTAKLYPERYSLVRFGTGFLRLALQTRSPIIPVACLGSGDAVPSFMNLEKLAKPFGIPYIPITPYVVPWPLPTRIDLHYGAPLTFPGDGTEEDEVIEKHVAVVRETIAGLLQQGLAARGQK